jgi:hypothetical protein
MRPFRKPKTEREPSAAEREFDRRRAAVAEMITGIERVREGSFDFYGIQGREGVVTPPNADTTLGKMRNHFGRDYPDLFPDMTAHELSASEPQRTSDVYAYPEINAQAALERAWTGQSNNFGL